MTIITFKLMKNKFSFQLTNDHTTYNIVANKTLKSGLATKITFSSFV